MNRDHVLGIGLLAGSVVGIIIYGFFIYMFPLIVLQITAFIAIAAVLTILAWIGYTMATIPPPLTIEELEKE